MASLTQLSERLTQLVSQLPAIAEASVRQTSRQYLDLQAAQFAMGLDSVDKPIALNGEGYTPYTKDLKVKFGVGLGKVTDRVTLYQTGQLYSQLKLDVQSGLVKITSDVPYWTDLESRTGQIIEGLTPDHLGEYKKQMVGPVYKAKIKDVTKLEFI